MNRPSSQTYRCQSLRDFAQQLRYAPANRRAEQIRRLEQLHDEIAPQAMYPLDYLAYRITRYRLERDDDIHLVGEAVSPDLRLMIDQLSRSIDMPITKNETFFTLDQWAERLQVSRKTLDRWRKAGLRWRWFTPGPGSPDPGNLKNDTPHIGLEETAVERFRATHAQRVENAAAFAHLDDAQRQHLVHQAREIKQQSPHLSLRQVAQRLASLSGRSVEAMRQLLEKQDKTSDPLFEDRRQPLTAREKKIITRAAERGVTFEKLAQRFARTRSTLHRIVQEHRAAVAKLRAIDYVKLTTFDRKDADDVLLGTTLPKTPDGPWSKLVVTDLSAPLQTLYRQRTFTDKTLRSTMIRYNYLKFKAACTRDAFTPYAPRVAQLKAFDDFLERADELRHRMIVAHLPTVLSVVKQHLVSQPHNPVRLVRLLKIGHAILFEAIDAYDASRTPTFEAHLRSLLRQRLTNERDESETRAHRRMGDVCVFEELADHARKHNVHFKA